MTLHLGKVKPGATLYIPFDTFAGATGASITMSGLATSDIQIYRNGSVTQRASTTGFTLLDTDGIDFDGLTGIHGLSIDLSSNATADFYTAGAMYWVVISSITVDSQTVSFVLATFTIGYEGAILDTTIATLSSQTSFTLTAGPAEDDALNGCEVIIHDIASSVQAGRAIVSDYTGSTRTVTLVAGTTFTAAAGDNLSVFLSALQPTVQGRALDVSTGGEAGIDWANIGSPTTAQNLSATNIDVDQVVASVSGAVGSVTGAVGSVTGNVGGNVTGSVGSVASGGITAASIAADAITAAAIAADAIGASELAADAVTEIQSGLATASALATVGGYIDTEIAAIIATLGTPAGASISADIAALPTAQELTDSVWDEPLASHLDSGSTGAGLNAAGSAGDPWSTSLPGAYGAGSAGKIVGDNLNATVSSRLASASYTAPLDAAGTRSAVGLASANLDTQLSAIDDAVDTEIAAIKAKTDTLPSDPADQSLLEAAISAAVAPLATAAAVAALPTANQNADALLDRSAGVETNRTLRQALRFILAACVGKLSGAATDTITIRDSNDSKDRIVATTDGDGNRSAVTLDGS